VIAIRFSQIIVTAAGRDGSKPVICFTLDTPPNYESEAIPTPESVIYNLLSQELFGFRAVPDSPPRQRRLAFDENHTSFVAYTSHAIRLECLSDQDLQIFRDHCWTAQDPTSSSHHSNIDIYSMRHDNKYTMPGLRTSLGLLPFR
jgi:RNA-dependent RNA polymerase